MNSKILGLIGENLAAKYYRDNKYMILAANYRTRQGEIDLIASKNNIVVFVEVKTRSQNSIATPREFVNTAKQKRIILAAQSYIQTEKLSNCNFRFDVCEVIKDEYENMKLNCIENAFELS